MSQLDEDGYWRYNTWFVQQKASIHYAFQCWDGRKDSKKIWNKKYSTMEYGERVQMKDEGAIVKMKYDVWEGRISFIANNKDQGIAFDDVESGNNIKYRLAIYMVGESVELLGVFISHS